jgi:hypothetical protein
VTGGNEYLTLLVAMVIMATNLLGAAFTIHRVYSRRLPSEVIEEQRSISAEMASQCVKFSEGNLVARLLFAIILHTVLPVVSWLVAYSIRLGLVDLDASSAWRVRRSNTQSGSFPHAPSQEVRRHREKRPDDD